ncbi:MAG: acetylxylan esterase [Armatimonadota bacterium]
MNLFAKTILCVLLLLLASTIGGGLFAGTAADGRENPLQFQSPEEIWKGYDPRALPLDIEIIKSWSEAGCWYEKFRFTGEISDGVKTRVLAVRGGPLNKRGVPGIMHIHGGGQTLSQSWVEFWAKRGYACISIDFCGKAYDRTEYTLWGPLETCNMPMAGDGVFTKPNLKASSWYHWVTACRRALTVLEDTQGVDKDKLGIFGISVGGTLCWMVAGCDHRVKVAAPIYGCGYNIDDRRPSAEGSPPDADHRYFKKILAPEAWAPYMKCPVLFLSATNDMHGRMPTAFDILGAVLDDTRQVFTAKYDHHVEPIEAKSLPLWMDAQLKGGAAFPKSPEVKVTLDSEGVPVASVSAGDLGGVTEVKVYYSLGEKVPGARFWRSVDASRSGRKWTAHTPVMDTWKSISVFANVYYKSGVALSSNLVHLYPAMIGRANATLTHTSELDNPVDIMRHWYFVPAYTDPNVDWSYLAVAKEADGSQYLTINPKPFGETIDFYIGSFLPGDEQYKPAAGKALSFEVKGGFTTDLTVMIVQNDRLLGGKTFTAKLPLSTGKFPWQSVELPLSAFKDEQGKPADSWAEIDKINITSKTSKNNPPGFREFKWVDENASQLGESQ